MQKKLPWVVSSILVLCVCLSSRTASATEYYVSQQASGLGDGRSIDNVASMADHNAGDLGLRGGDTVYLVGDFTTPLVPPSSGTTVLGPITYDGLVDDDCALDAQWHWACPSSAAIIDLGASDDRSSSCIVVEGKHHLVFQDLELRGAGNGVKVVGKEFGSSNIKLQRNKIWQLSAHGFWSSDEDVDDISGTVRHLNVSIGGSETAGNEFYRIGEREGDADIDVSAIDDVILSYNHLWSDAGVDGLAGTSDDQGIAGIICKRLGITELVGVRNTLIEHNRIRGHNAPNDTSVDNIGARGIMLQGALDVIVRFNQIFDHVANGALAAAIVIGGDAQRIHVFGNHIYDNQTGIYVYDGNEHEVGCSDLVKIDGGSCGNGVSVDHINIFANVIHDADEGSGVLIGGGACVPACADPDPDPIRNVRIYNNTIVHCASSASSAEFTGLSLRSAYDLVDVKNNVFSSNRPQASDGVQVFVENGSGVTLDYNHYEAGSNTAKIHWVDSDFSPVALTSNNGQAAHASQGNLNFRDAQTNNYRLLENSACKDTGLDLTALESSIDIGNITYTAHLDEGLDDSLTRFDLAQQKFVMAAHSAFGLWDRGAFVYTNQCVAEICEDGIDNDCDELVDVLDALDCAGLCRADEQRSCYEGPLGTRGRGICQAGFQVCDRGDYGPCQEQVLPSLEDCKDGLDNDCDGKIDGEDAQDCPAVAPPPSGNDDDVNACGCDSAHTSVGTIALLLSMLVVRVRGRRRLRSSHF